MALKIPDKPDGAPGPRQRVMMRATLPSTASMLTDLRKILVSQISQHAKDSVSELFDTNRVKALAQLAQTLVLLEKQTSEEQAKIEDMMDSLTPEEQDALALEARLLLGGG